MARLRFHPPIEGRFLGIGARLLSPMILVFSLFGGIRAGMPEEDPAEWRATLDGIPESRYPDLSPVEATFEFGWADVVRAGNARLRFRHLGEGRYRAEAEGSSEGAVRLLWPLDASFESEGSFETLLASHVLQEEKYRGKTLTTRLHFDGNGVRRLKESTRDKPGQARWKEYRDSEVRDLLGAMLVIRSQPLAKGDRINVIAYPGANPFLVTVSVAGLEKVTVQGKEREAIRLDLEIRQISTEEDSEGELIEFSKFKAGRVWLSDDEQRLPVRAEIDTFVGYVYGELESVEWGNPDAAP